MPETLLLIDYENVKDSGLDQLPKHDRALLFIGRGQKPKLAFIQARLTEGTRLDLVQVAEQGRNNLDFYIAHYLGAVIAENPGGRFIVFSNDTDLDYLLAHLRQRSIDCTRVGPHSKAKLAGTRSRTATASATMPVAAAPKPRAPARQAAPKAQPVKPAPLRAVAKPSPVIPERKPEKPAARQPGAIKDENYNEAVWFLTHNKRRQPKNMKALLNSLASHLQLMDKPADVARIVDALVARGVIEVRSNRVTYPG